MDPLTPVELAAKKQYISYRLDGLEQEVRALPPFDDEDNMRYVRDTMRIRGEMLGLSMCRTLHDDASIGKLARGCDTHWAADLLEFDVRYASEIILPRSLMLREDSLRWFVGGMYASVMDIKAHQSAMVSQRIDDGATRPIDPSMYLNFRG